MKHFPVLPILLFTSMAQAELVGLDETSLEGISGQTGIGVNIDKIIHVGSLTYSDKDGSSGGDLQFDDISIGDPNNVTGATAHSQHLINIDGSAGLFIDSRFEATRIQIGGISVGSHIGSRSFGQFIYDFEGTNLLQIGGNTPSGFLINSTTSLTNMDYIWSTNGASLHLDNMTMGSNLKDAVFEEKDIGGGISALVIDIASYTSTTNIGGICLSTADCTAAISFGSFSREINLINSRIQMYGGGREGKGITMNTYFEFDETVNNTGDGNVSSYTDDASIKLAKQAGNVAVTGFTFDIGLNETNIGDHIALQWDQVVGTYKVGSIEIAGASMGSYEVQFNFNDAIHDGTTYQNKLLLAPGVAFAAQDFSSDAALSATGFDAYMTNFYSKVTNTSDGISLFNEWNLTADILYTDDSNTIVIDDYLTYGNGYTTLELRTGDLSIDASNDDNESFLAIGVRDYKVNYSMAGLKVGAQDSQLQNGYEFLGLSPEAEFTMNAAIEIRAGGSVGSGVTFDGDVLLSDANFAITKTDLGSKNVGVYLDGVTYEYHFRDVTLDVESEGIKLALGEMWSEFTANDVRFGDKDTGSSMGAMVVKQYQSGSTITVSAGGSNTAKCMNGTGIGAGSCNTDGGYWLDTGTQGLTVTSKKILQKRSGEKENSITLITNRSDVANNATGMQLKIDNIYTSDGYDDTTNTYGVQSSVSVDVAKVRVLKKTTGADSNGIGGTAAIGDEVITSGTGATQYTYVTNPTLDEQNNRPSGLIVSSNLSINELNFESVQLLHPNAIATPATLLHGVVLQNMNLNSTLSITPIR